MSEVHWLGAALVALYLVECAAFLPHGALLVVMSARGRPRLRQPSRVLRGATGTVVLRHPLWFFGRGFVVEAWPMSFDEEAIVNVARAALTLDARPPVPLRRLPWQDVATVRAAQRDVEVNGALFVRCATPAHARHAAAVIEELRRAPGRQQRGQLIEQRLDLALDPSRTDERLRWAMARSRAPAWLGALMALQLFVIVPAVLFALGLAWWPLAVLPLLVLSVIGLWCAVRAMRAVDDSMTTSRLFSAALTLGAPTSLMRAGDRVVAEALADRHPLSVALLLSRTDPSPVRSGLRALRHVTPLPLPPNVAEVEARFRALLVARLQHALRSLGHDPDDAEAPPPMPPSQTAWCPRCRQTFKHSGLCSDCGVALRTRETSAARALP